MGDKRDDDSGESREQDRIMRGYKLGDVSHDMWKRKFLDVAVRFGMEVLLELETETLWAYEEDEPLEEDEVEVSVRNRTTQIISKTFKVWDEARDREPLQKRWKVWPREDGVLREKDVAAVADDHVDTYLYCVLRSLCSQDLR